MFILRQCYSVMMQSVQRQQSITSIVLDFLYRIDKKFLKKTVRVNKSLHPKAHKYSCFDFLLRQF